jgi:hypothetical protein
MTSSSVVGFTSRRRGDGQSAPTRAWGRVPLLLLTAAVVVSTGTVVASITDTAPPPSTTEQARLDALAGLEDLALAFEEHDGDRNGATAALLRNQADLLRLTTSWPSGSPAAEETPDPATPAATAPGASPSEPPPGPKELAGLAASLLSDALKADPGLARLLASVGSAVFAQAQTLDGGAELETPWEATGIPPASGNCTPADGKRPSPTTTAPTTAEAVAAVVRSQERLVYAYETVLPRLAGSEREDAARRLSAHAESAEKWRAVGAAMCFDLPLPDPTYQLDSGFDTEPRQALFEAEIAALVPLADAVAFSGEPVREHAVEGLAGAAADVARTTGNVPPAPGLKDELLAAPPTAS